MIASICFAIDPDDKSAALEDRQRKIAILSFGAGSAIVLHPLVRCPREKPEGDSEAEILDEQNKPVDIEEKREGWRKGVRPKSVPKALRSRIRFREVRVFRGYTNSSFIREINLTIP
ncbi:hypothetical protein [Gimesia aquarii]|uniref:Uncharacterized protein n=1 Tax=Gimesia aquarii TaxID=2527964 RepID=A0A517X0L5_9PLAN|nr:hypothetical protein [Gimesia aquarii]QDU11041.1 hypothetical protein V202x_44570 [Gimesia aquarii]